MSERGLARRNAVTVRHTGVSVEIVVGDVAIARYVFEPDAPAAEAPKPYLHPLRTLSGAPLSVHRPWDHRWHKGLQMTLSEVSGENFWGGPTYTPGAGYVWKENLGRILHTGFDDGVTAADAQDHDEVALAETLDWVASSGERWFAEHRRQRFHGVDVARGLWAFDFDTSLENVSGRRLDLGSPTTLGREAAGYTGLFWRGPRSWTGARVTAAGVPDGDDPMGVESDWLALSSQNDDRDGGATVLAIAGSSSADVPLAWFVRAEPFAAIAPSPAFGREVALEPGRG
ncbi:hypothetical protein GCM10025867_45110 [Frondihabitans sucicola]|uniref:Oxidoreductase n=1 Tax=Frondihabitans sucicola TaxID=1268041 RepID=A0ABM8GHG2_9MICO|nr:PmoA family protein [Frondihabitans sucicola]BDZ47797.1 hypothetical protein GCM10025867_00380 [Frondihabitans sucicola]BDZ52270.1 hypothetical protein GCM10025867_45110 [Frondihabitans sucicola]